MLWTSHSGSATKLLDCAGYAALYPERPLELSEMQGVREALRRIIDHHEPYPAFVVDRKWRVVMNDEGAARIVAACCLDEETVRALSTDGSLNFMRMMFESTRMRPRILNWTFVAPRLLARLRREAAGDAQSPSSALLREVAPTANCGQAPTEHFETLAPTVPLEISWTTIVRTRGDRALARLHHQGDIIITTRRPERRSEARDALPDRVVLLCIERHINPSLRTGGWLDPRRFQRAAGR